MKYLLIVSVLFVINIAYTIAQIYQPSLFETDFFIFSPELVPLFISGIIVIFTFYLYLLISRRPSSTDKVYPVQEETIIQNINSSLYTDQLLIENFPNILCIKDQGGRWLQASSEYLIYLDMKYIDYFSACALII